MAQAITDLQQVIIGNDVDDGTGDYLRKGGEKINSNFDSLFYALGDGVRPAPAGAWKNWKHSDGATLSPKFGESWTIDTQGGKVTVQLPKGNATKYNSVIKLRDIWNSWNVNTVTLAHQPGDTIKGKAGTVIIHRAGADLELVYCANGRWDYVDNKTVGKITTSDMATVVKASVLITDAMGPTTDFKDLFAAPYNTAALNVYHRGNLLWYGDRSNENSQYGSIGSAAGQIVDLDGNTIRLRNAAMPGDTVIFETFMDGIASYRASYQRFTIQVLDQAQTGKVSVNGKTIVADLKTKLTFNRDEFGFGPQDFPNPNTVEVLLNGHELNQAGTAGYPQYKCVGADGEDAATCTANGGQWTFGGPDFSLTYDDFDRVNGIQLGQELEHQDILVIKWFNNDIGSTLDWDGTDGIRERAEEVFLNSEEVLNLTNRIEYTDYENPSQATRVDAPPFTGRIQDIRQLFDVLYPIGTIYTNAHNMANPANYLGFGVWRRWAEGLASVGWSEDSGNIFNTNPQDGTRTAGGVFGETNSVIKPINIPEMKTAEDVLVRDDTGPIIIGSCMADPDTTGPAETKYRVDKATISNGNTTPVGLNIIQPSITEYKWIRVG
ncbi:baseplate wedge subunit and tail pin [Serratia phage 4S]|nr:baseplate wedge subunit and tail pin [Serratia phage 4S]